MDRYMKISKTNKYKTLETTNENIDDKLED